IPSGAPYKQTRVSGFFCAPHVKKLKHQWKSGIQVSSAKPEEKGKIFYTFQQPANASRGQNIK
ncbi:MAG: hypothetical protein ABW153_04190, partial [Sedimenticola sp.]